jgi:hypothetical protein
VELVLFFLLAIRAVVVYSLCLPLSLLRHLPFIRTLTSPSPPTLRLACVLCFRGGDLGQVSTCSSR